MAGRNEKKNITKSKIVNYIINNKITSKAELAQNLSLSMPTVLSNVNELIDRNMVIEIGEYESTGGRKAKRIGINPAYKYAVGVVITANHLGIVLLNMQYEIEKTIRMRLKFSTETSYCLEVAEQVENFLKDVEDREKILGIGRSVTYRFLEKTFSEQKPFKVLKVGKMYRVPKKGFDEWLNG